MKKRALISVYNKERIVPFAQELERLDWQIISTGGTYSRLKAEGIQVLEVSDVTGFAEILDGRVKTLHPHIHAGILYKRDNTQHAESIKKLNLFSIDMVVNNLYPFETVLNDKKNTHDILIENIDIGGPSMIRAAAKNYNDVCIVTDPDDYDEIINRLKTDTLDKNFRLSLARKAFNYTAYYDALIADYFNNLANIPFPDTLTLSYRKKQDLRYGENPHQKAAFYERVYVKENEKAVFTQLHGKELSYNNLGDIYSAVKMIKEFEEPAAIGIKHGNPSGIGTGNTIDEAFDKAYNCDPVSIFGGIIILNGIATKYIAEKINGFFLEVIIAKAFDTDALSILRSKKNIRIIEIKNLQTLSLPARVSKEVLNGLLYQDYDAALFLDDLKFVTQKKPDDEQLKNLIFAFKACKCVSSNGIVLTKNGGTVGIGQGEVRRSWAAEQTIARAGKNCTGAVMASDGFFFEDTVELLHQNNITAVIQPGGSVKDENVIRLCDTYGIAMVFASVRHFRH